MSILRQQRRLWFLAGASTGALGLFILEVRSILWTLSRSRSHKCVYTVPQSAAAYIATVCQDGLALLCGDAESRMNLQKEAAEGFGRIAAQLPGAHAPPAIKVCQDHTTNRVVNTCVFVGQACIEKALCASYCWPAR
jgi:hypothetical protein